MAWEPTSDATGLYNCCAYAVGIENQFLWPGRETTDWPIVVDESLEEFTRFFAGFGFEPCGGPFDELNINGEPGYERIALYVIHDNSRDEQHIDYRGVEIEHVAKQLKNGRWTSKLSEGIDIEHDINSFPDYCKYGRATHFFKRPIPGYAPPQILIVSR